MVLQPPAFYFLIEKGERSVKVRIDHAGIIVAAKEDSYKCFYKDDGLYTYPRLPETRLRVKGELYFKNMEITRSKEGTEREAKMDILPYHRRILFPRLEELSREFGEEGEDGVELIPYYQMNGAGPHQCEKLLIMIDEEFN